MVKCYLPKSLFDGLEDVEPDLWKDVILMQKEWIGKCDGVRLEFDLPVSIASHYIR